jgi:hypothetical protein
MAMQESKKDRTGHLTNSSASSFTIIIPGKENPWFLSETGVLENQFTGSGFNSG